jgi:hypothetical protein
MRWRIGVADMLKRGEINKASLEKKVEGVVLPLRSVEGSDVVNCSLRL